MKRDIGGVGTALLAAALAGLLVGGCTAGRADASRSSDQAADTARARDAGQPADTAHRQESAAPQLPGPGKAWVIFGSDTVVAEVARTAEQREKGLMYRESVPDGTGMLFVFDQVGPQSFWMQNTYVALDIAFMDASYAVVDIQQMEPQTTTPHESAAPALFALEVPKGWFEAHGVHAGSVPDIVFGPQIQK